MLANNYIGLWLASHVGMMLLLLACVQHAQTYFLLLLIGTLMGGGCYSITLDGDIFRYFPLEYIPLFFFLNIVGVYFAHLAKLNIVENIDSWARQLVDLDELILVDDFSTDDSYELVKSWLENKAWNISE